MELWINCRVQGDPFLLIVAGPFTQVDKVQLMGLLIAKSEGYSLINFYPPGRNVLEK